MRHFLRFIGMVFFAAILTALCGCETESVSQSDLTITPPSATVREGQSVVFTASGGYEYTWSLENEATDNAWAVLSTRKGHQTTYTSMRDAGSNAVVRVLTVTSTISDTVTNAAANTATAEAYITHL